jgi:phospholipid/cholesterol/gamma-HCH transport system ATP-binding protein
MISVKNISKSFSGEKVLHNISVEFEPGKTNLIIGKSGSGKTVLLKSIIGLHEVDEGSIIYKDIDLVTMPQKQRSVLRKEMGMLFQGSALFDSLTVEENIRFPLDMFTSMSDKEKLDRVNFCLNRVNLNKVNHLFPAELSGGMQKRVAIARAIVLNPKYLFCDEPNSGLDPKTALVIDKLICDITEEYHITTIVIYA